MKTCEHCACEFEKTDPDTLYCPDCAGELKDIQRTARSKSVGKNFFADGKFAVAKDCPRTYVGLNDEQACGVCGSDAISPTVYGFCVFGLGVSQTCMTCRVCLNFKPDTDD